MIIDISWPISERMVEYKDKKLVEIVKTKKFTADKVRDAVLRIGTHTGTHVDAPAHILKNGKTIDTLPIESLQGPCKVLDVTSTRGKITAQVLKKHEIKEDDIVLLKTKNSDLPATGKFYTSFVYLEQSGAEHLARKKVKAVGFDYLGVERKQKKHETHKTLLKKNIFLIEGLRLKKVKSGKYYLLCLPLLVKGANAAPARAVLVKQ
jgi:arylformamidase